MEPKDLILIGRIVGVRGVQGDIRIKSFTSAPEDIGSYGPFYDASGQRSFTVTVLGASKGVVIGHIEGIENRTEAEALKGMDLYVPREALPAIEEEDSFYQVDLIGLTAEDEDGNILGSVSAVHDYGAGDILEIAREGEEDLLVPFTKEAVPEVDIGGGRIVCKPPKEI